MPSGISWEAKTARPAVGVSRISKRGVEGAPGGRALENSVGGAEDADEGRDMLHADDAVVEVGSSEGYIVGDRSLMGDPTGVSQVFDGWQRFGVSECVCVDIQPYSW